jgi:uncharacterized membrane protein YeiH
MEFETPDDVYSIVHYLDLIGTLVFAISGAMAASSKKLDLFGAAFTAFVTAVGGGTIRDLLLGLTPVGWVSNVIYLWIILGGVVITFLFYRFIRKLRKTLFLFDTIGIGVFTILGIKKALLIDIAPGVAVMMGMFSAVLGGVIRDILINEIPLIFRKEIYAMACIIGGVVYFILKEWISLEWTTAIAISTVIFIRILAIKYRIGLPALKA